MPGTYTSSEEEEEEDAAERGYARATNLLSENSGVMSAEFMLGGC